MTTISDKKSIDLYRLKVLRTSLLLEIAGMTRRGRSAYSVIKSEFKLKGSRERVYDQLVKIIEEAESNR